MEVWPFKNQPIVPRYCISVSHLSGQKKIMHQIAFENLALQKRALRYLCVAEKSLLFNHLFNILLSTN